MTTTHTPIDTLGVVIEVGDFVRITSWGAPVRRADVGHIATVAGFTSRGNVVLEEGGFFDPIANGRAVSPGMLGVMRRDGDDGYEGNRDLYSKAGA